MTRDGRSKAPNLVMNRLGKTSELRVRGYRGNLWVFKGFGVFRITYVLSTCPIVVMPERVDMNIFIFILCF